MTKCNSNSDGIPDGYECHSAINVGSFCSPTCSTGYSGSPSGSLRCSSLAGNVFYVNSVTPSGCVGIHLVSIISSIECHIIYYHI